MTFIRSKSITGFADYNDTSSSNGVPLIANTWTDLPNDGLGAATNLEFLPSGIDSVMDVSTGYIDLTQLKKGDAVIIRNSFEVTPNRNRADLNFRYSLGGGLGGYNLRSFISRLDSGAGRSYPWTLYSHLIYVGDDNTRLNPIKLQLNLSRNGSFVNYGTAIQILRK